MAESQVRQDEQGFAAGHRGSEHFTVLKLLNACILDRLGKWLTGTSVWLLQSLTPVPLTSGENERQRVSGLKGAALVAVLLFRDAMLVLKSQTLWLSLLRAGISDQHTPLRRPFQCDGTISSLHHGHHTTDLKGICFCLLLNEFGLVLMKGGHRSRGELCIFLWEFF